ncbi:MAG: M20/M25/M40 family metallo-hydrolase [Acidobacteria bacterium]|nr:MAG: M20/M25/M40 family metallo-hydrolase [Acidobacteriota bacterium]REJ98720.1 MAG: M20/M25/M40 family metallo-hydrolase [Acidobacteriota bacterium]REK16625.1 MAG: M20/M25/M40 family metallo-hydrolase [Acidobacteriota bacterium]REK42536.1 MAG: M20/M25/M40 family metallo-hydrolase [Acidobacteriota bacterium]
MRRRVGRRNNWKRTCVDSPYTKALLCLSVQTPFVGGSHANGFGEKQDMKKRLIALAAVASIALQAAAFAFENSVTITEAEKKMAENITAEQLRDYLYFVASDEMGGRDTPSRGLDLTAKFLALNLSRWGFKPAGDDGSYFQKMWVVSDSIDQKATKLTVNEKEFSFGKDFYLLRGKGMVEGDLVFGGNGWMVKSKNFDAFEGVDVRDKVVVVYQSGFNGRGFQPPGGLGEGGLGGDQGVDWANPLDHAKMKGAKGVVIVADPQIQGFWPQLGNFLGRGRAYIEGLQEGGSSADSLPLFLVSQTAGSAIFEGTPGNQESESAFAIGKTARLSAVGKSERVPTQNVVALWEGGDPKLKAEMVAIGAHYDHVGTRETGEGDRIFNGADDDGSGTVAVLAIAEALAKAPKRPNRSVLLVWHAGEEKGLWGSEYFNKFPTVDIKNVVAQLNLDMIGRSKKPGDDNPKNKELSGEDEIYVIGSEMMSSKLGEVTKGTNSGYLGMKYNYKYDDPKDPNRFFFRSDHFNYAVNGIPVVFWFDGVHEDYHQAGDHADKIDYQKMEKVTRTIFLTLWEIAQLDERPAVDKQLPPELSSRG